MRAPARTRIVAAAAAGAGLAAGYVYSSRGPGSFRAEYRRRVAELARPVAGGVVTEVDLAALPPLVAAYVRRSGAVGEPRVTGLRARLHGRIRSGKVEPWMPFTAEQFNVFGARPTRLFLMHARKFGLPVDVLHVYDCGTATMRVKAASLVTMVDAAGPEMDEGETVTVFNDLCLLAPAALVDAPVTWDPVDASSIRGTYTVGSQQVRATLVFDDGGDLVDFVSDDRLRASPDGTSFERQRWSTPVSGYSWIGDRRVAAVAEGRWHAPAPEGEFAYVDLRVDDVTDGVGHVGRGERVRAG